LLHTRERAGISTQLQPPIPHSCTDMPIIMRIEASALKQDGVCYGKFQDVQILSIPKLRSRSSIHARNVFIQATGGEDSGSAHVQEWRMFCHPSQPRERRTWVDANCIRDVPHEHICHAKELDVGNMVPMAGFSRSIWVVQATT
jgi:hypothetical protein